MMIDAVIEKAIKGLNLARALQMLEKRGLGSDIVLLIAGIFGLLITIIFGIIAFVRFQASPELLRFLVVASLFWIVPSFIGNKIADEYEKQNEGEK